MSLAGSAIQNPSPTSFVQVFAGGNLSAVIAATPASRTIVLGAGTFTITATIALTKAVNIVGTISRQNAGTVITPASDITLFSINTDGVTFQNISFVQFTGGSASCITFINTVVKQDFWFEKCVFSGTTSAGGYGIDNSAVYTNSTNTLWTRVVGCQFLGISGIEADALEGLTVEDCRFDTLTTGINAPQGGYGYVVVSDSVFNNNTNAIILKFGGHAIVSRNHFTLISQTAVLYYSGESAVISSNIIENAGDQTTNTYPAISVYGATAAAGQYILVADNIVVTDLAGHANQPNYCLNIQSNSAANISATSNRFANFGTAAISHPNLLQFCRDNAGFNPQGLITNPFYAAYLGFGGSTAVPVASTNYTVAPCDGYITAANSANANNSISITRNGTTVVTAQSTLTMFPLLNGDVINWGAFTGAAGAVSFWSS
jgi:hypothetical protein